MRRPSFVRRLLLAAAAAVLAAGPSAAAAQGWPERPLRLVVPAPTGGGMDGLGRALAEVLAPLLKQPVVVENRAGANSIVGSQAVARAAPDGYTVLLTASFHAMHPWTVRSLPYDGLKDFAAVAPLGASPLVFVASAQSGVRTVADFRTFAASRRDAVPFAASAMETRLAAEVILQKVGAKPQIVLYKGTGPAMTDIAGGHVPLFVTTFTSVLPFKDTGKVNVIGVASKERSPFLPDVPTLAEQGLPVEVGVWYGLLAPAGTPPEIVQRLNAEVARAARLPEYQAKLRTLSVEPMLASPAEFDAFVRAETARWRDIVRTAGIEPE